jgi:hypothetical protein
VNIVRQFHKMHPNLLLIVGNSIDRKYEGQPIPWPMVKFPCKSSKHDFDSPISRRSRTFHQNFEKMCTSTISYLGLEYMCSSTISYLGYLIL